MNAPAAESLPMVGPGPVEAVRFVAPRERPAGGRAESWSRPGHLIQLTTAGRCWHEVSGRRYVVEPGCVMWFHEVEPVRTEVWQGPWCFLALNFIAPSLGPPSFDARLRRVDQATRDLFTQLHRAWCDTQAAPVVRSRRVRGWLELLLAELTHGDEETFAVQPGTALWWTLETQLRERLDQRLALDDLATLAQCSPATVARACKTATGMPPLRRLKQVRLTLGRALVRQTTRRISEIADDVGYERVHEFSRDYRRWFDCTPTDDRKRVRAAD